MSRWGWRLLAAVLYPLLLCGRAGWDAGILLKSGQTLPWWSDEFGR